MYGKQIRRSIREAHQRITSTTAMDIQEVDWLDLILPIPNPENLQIGEILHMDFGFPRGQQYEAKDEYGHLVTSIDGH
jgi:hypothetical protein